jgi:hypothetical protein
MHLKILHTDTEKADKAYQNWVEEFKRAKQIVEVIGFASNTAYGKTTLTIHYRLLKD